MKIVIIAHYDPNLFPALHYLATALADAGAQVDFVSNIKPVTTGVSSPEVTLTTLPKVKGVMSRIPWFRANQHTIYGFLRVRRPDWIIAQHESLIPALIYKATLGAGKSKVAAYFCDPHDDRAYVKLAKQLAGLLDAYVDICHLRVQWRQDGWSRMRANPFIIRQAPLLDERAAHTPHDGMARVVFTASKNILGMNRSRISCFLKRLCEEGISVDWYLPGTEDVRTDARSLVSHPLYTVKEPITKPKLLSTLKKYDVGLFWAPMAEANKNRSYFVSAASNKIGEYIAAGLVVAHTGNPGLSYLPEEICAPFDPDEPNKAAEQLAQKLSNRHAVELKRKAALRYHQNGMNFLAQAAPFIRYLLDSSSNENRSVIEYEIDETISSKQG